MMCEMMTWPFRYAEAHPSTPSTARSVDFIAAVAGRHERSEAERSRASCAIAATAMITAPSTRRLARATI